MESEREKEKWNYRLNEEEIRAFPTAGHHALGRNGLGRNRLLTSNRSQTPTREQFKFLIISHE